MNFMYNVLYCMITIICTVYILIYFLLLLLNIDSVGVVIAVCYYIILLYYLHDNAYMHKNRIYFHFETDMYIIAHFSVKLNQKNYTLYLLRHLNVQCNVHSNQTQRNRIIQ
eukprot:172376_1